MPSRNGAPPPASPPPAARARPVCSNAGSTSITPRRSGGGSSAFNAVQPSSAMTFTCASCANSRFSSSWSSGCSSLTTRRSSAAHQLAGEQRAAGIARQRPPPGIEPPHDAEVRRQHFRGSRRKPRLHHAADPLAPFAGFLRRLGAEIVDADAGMRVDDAERRRLQLQVLDDERQHGVLDDVREISGVVGVAVVHGPRLERAGAVLSRVAAPTRTAQLEKLLALFRREPRGAARAGQCLLIESTEGPRS